MLWSFTAAAADGFHEQDISLRFSFVMNHEKSERWTPCAAQAFLFKVRISNATVTDFAMWTRSGHVWHSVHCVRRVFPGATRQIGARNARHA